MSKQLSRAMMKDRYVVQATAYGEKNKQVTNEMNKKDAQESAKRLNKSMKIAIPKYKWASNIKIKKVIKDE